MQKFDGEILALDAICIRCGHKFEVPIYSEKYNKGAEHSIYQFNTKLGRYEWVTNTCVRCPKCAGGARVNFEDVDIDCDRTLLQLIRKGGIKKRWVLVKEFVSAEDGGYESYLAEQNNCYHERIYPVYDTLEEALKDNPDYGLKQ